MKTKLNARDILLASLACLLWGSAFPILKIIYSEMMISGEAVGDRLLLAGTRFFAAGLLIFLYYLIRFKSMPKLSSKKELKDYSLLGLSQTALLYMFFYQGVANTTGVKSSILSQISIFFVILLSYFILKEKLSKNKIIGLITGFTGIFLLNVNTIAQGSDFFSFSIDGDGFLILSGLSGSIGTILAKKIASKYNPIKTTAFQMTLGAMLLILLGIISGGHIFDKFTPLSLILFSYSCILGAAAFTIWFNLLSRHEAGIITLFKFLIPIFGSLLSILLIPGESFSTNIIFGLVFVVFGIIYINKKETLPLHA